MRHERGDLAALDAADLQMVGSHHENGCGRGLAEFRDVIGVTIENGPPDTGRSGCASDLGKSGAADRLKDDGIGAVRLFGLDGLEKLRALSDGVVIGVNDLELDAEFPSGFFCGLRLFDLIIVVVGRQ